MSLVIQDAFTKWLQSYPSKSKAVEEVILAVKRFLGPDVEAKHAYCVCSSYFSQINFLEGDVNLQSVYILICN